ncbi:methionine aminopeptidase, type I [Neorickettsia helminthoeca str. Oregon]|uniref:Methionine aminopeptidase n=1 Tax=Neorickettsia helminthoeca str. Oregon TaxID=1286528 RepID=X5GW25_9RICK|nr:type I methionyl aminopeptidase [Neorickettsia helminthoeca]AHX11277.1 methionine aminopeptidase, type I [Neorickettsia helminthoeca str. Oregon]
MSKIKIHPKSDFEYMRRAGRLAAEVLDYITEFVKPDVTTNELDRLCHEFIVKAGAVPAPLNYKGFPKSICTSKNNVICHGIPDEVPLKKGDILNIDVTVILDGWHGDTSRMYFVGTPSIKGARLCEATYGALMAGIEVVRPGIPLNRIGCAIEDYISQQYSYSIVDQYCGHGIGRSFHEPPSVVHYATDSGNTIILEPGMFFTIEPMINEGKPHAIVDKNDGWTVRTKDLSLSAQFEHTIAVTEDGYEIFTLSPAGLHHPKF